MSAAMAVASIQSVPGTPGSQDEKDFCGDPAGFSTKGLRTHGPVFSTGVAGGAVFVGDAASLTALSSAPVDVATPTDGSSVMELAAPFAPSAAVDNAADDLFVEHAEAFNKVVYDELFLWIPRYKEAGFQTFRFEDFIDGRVRRLLPSVRLLVLHAASPVLFGVPYAELPQQLGFENKAALDKAYGAHAAKVRPAKMTEMFSMPSLYDLEGSAATIGGDTNKLREGLAAYARKRGGGGDGDAELWQLTSSVEQTAALVCNMLAAAKAHPECLAVLESEQAAILKGTTPTCAITSAMLEDMPQLDAYARETMRVYPPSRPARVRLAQPTEIPLSSGGALELPAGALVAPEPFVARGAVERAEAFSPARFADAASAPTLLPFGSATRAGGGGVGVGIDAAGSRLAVSMSKATYVQMRRMFDEIILGQSPPPIPAGCPVHTIGEKIEVLCKPKMFYELQRGVKQLKF